MEENGFINSQSQQNNFELDYEAQNTIVSEGFVSADQLDEKERQEILSILNSNSAETEGNFDYNDGSDYVYNATGGNTNNVSSEIFKIKKALSLFLSKITGMDTNTISQVVDVFNPDEVKAFLMYQLEDWFYPSNDVKMLAQYINYGGTLETFLERLRPIDTSKFQDDEIVKYAYYSTMSREALDEYIDMLQETGKLKSKANEIREQLGVINPSPDTIVKEQKERLEQIEQMQKEFKEYLSKIVKEKQLAFKNQNERTRFINSLSEMKAWTDDSGQIVFNGTEFFYILQNDINALIETAYYLWNYDEMKEKVQYNNELIEKMKENVIKISNKGLSDFFANKNFGQ